MRRFNKLLVRQRRFAGNGCLRPLLRAVFYGIVNQVADDVAEVRTVCREGVSPARLDVRRDMHGLLRLQFMLSISVEEMLSMDSGSGCRRKVLRRSRFHGEHLARQVAEPLQLLLADAQILVACAFSSAWLKFSRASLAA